MQPLKGSDRRYLRGQAHSLEPVVRVGKNGLTDELIASVNEALNARELIKVKFMDFKDEKKSLSADISQKTQSELVGLIGNIAIFYREHPDKDKRKIKLPY